MHGSRPLPADVLNAFSSRQFLKRQRPIAAHFLSHASGLAPAQHGIQSAYPSMLKLHGRPYYRVMNSCRGSYENTAHNNARMYIYDDELQQKTQASHLDDETVKFIADKLKQHNSWVKEYLASLVEIDNSDGDNMSISFEETSRVEPTAKTEITALLYKDNTAAPTKRHVYTFPRNRPTSECEKSRFVPIYQGTQVVISLCNTHFYTFR